MTTNYDFILHITTECNFNCSYCNVVKGGNTINNETLDKVIDYAKNHFQEIGTFKFFGGEPLLKFDSIKYVLDSLEEQLTGKFEIVTNASVLNDEIGYYFGKYFKNIFVSIDCENNFDYNIFNGFVEKFSLKSCIIFNLMIDSNNFEQTKHIFQKLYNYGYRRFNILPIYFTRERNKEELKELSIIMKEIMDLSVKDNEIYLFGFQKNNGYNLSLSYDSLFCNYDGKVYYTDFVSTIFGQKTKEDLYMGEVGDLNNISLHKISEKKKILTKYEKDLSSSVKGLKQLHEIMDYFSIYLNNFV